MHYYMQRNHMTKGADTMKIARQRIRTSLLICAVYFICMGTSHRLYAQQVIGVSLGYEYFPYVGLTEPVPGAEGVDVQARAWRAGAAFPLMFAGGKIIVLNQLNYKRVGFYYKNYPENEDQIDQLQSVDYTFFLIDSLSTKWKMAALLIPGLASDFEGKLSGDDFMFQAAFGFIRQMKKDFQLGFGVAYFREFGPPLIMPFLYFDWKINPRWSVYGLVPQSLDITCQINPMLDLGCSLKIDGNRYHGNPDKYPEANPQIDYSEGTLSPNVHIHLSKWVHLYAEGGYAFYRNFRFLDGSEEILSLDLKHNAYVRTGFVLGM